MWRKLLVGLGVALFLGVVAALWFRSARAGALEVCMTGLRARGEKLTFEELAGGDDFTGEESVGQFLDVVERIPRSSVSVMEFVGPGIARVAWAAGHPPSSSKAKEDPATWEEWHGQIDAASGVVAELREVLRDPALRRGLQGTNAILYPSGDLVLRRNAATWLANTVLADLRRGRLQHGLENLTALIDLARAGREEPTLVRQMGRVAIGRLGLSVTWEALQRENWTDSDLARLQQEWEDLDFLRALETGWVGDRAMVIHMFGWAREQTAQTHATGSLGERFHARALGWIWRPDREALFYLEHMQALLDNIRALAAGRSWPVVQSAIEKQKLDLDQLGRSIFRYRYLFSLMAIPNLTRGIQAAVQAETERRLTVLALALRRYELRHGRPPGSLDALVPGLPAEVLRDPMSGEPFRYRLEPDGSYTLHSVGLDGSDDGGDPTPADPHAQHGLWTGRDAVWPAPASSGTLRAVNP